MALPNINASLGIMQQNGHPLMMPRGGQLGAPGPLPMRSQISPNPPMMTTSVHPTSQPSNTRLSVVQETGPSPPQKSSDTKESDPRMDSPSARGIFGWTTIDEANVPYLLRDDKRFVAVRMVEMKLLSKFPSTYPEELQNKPPLMSHYVTAKEAKLLNEINAEHCRMEFGRQSFNGRDLIVKLEDFIDFYNIVRKHFPDSSKKSSKPKPPTPVEGGWIQVNNTVVPFVLRGTARFVPLSVIRYAAGLLSEVPVEGHLPTPEECTYLNDNCKKAGLTFTFAKATKLIPAEVVNMKSDVPVQIQDLPKEDPFSYAEIKMTSEEEIPQNPLAASSASQPFPSITQGLPASQTSSSMHGNMSRQNMPPNTSQFWMNPHMGIYPTQSTNIPQQYRPQPFMNQTMQMINNGQSEQMRNYLTQGSSRNLSPASRQEVNNNGSMKTVRNVASHPEPRPLSAGGRSSTSGEFAPAVPGQRRLSGSAVSTSRGSTPPQVANRMPHIGPPGWHPTMGSPEEYQRMLHMLGGQQNASRQNTGSVPSTRAPLAQLERMGPSLSQPSSSSGVSSVIRGPSKGSKRSPTLPRSSSTDSLSSAKPGTSSSSKSSLKDSKIKPVEFFGKTLSCLIKGPARDSYALVEAVARVYFPFCTLDEFQFALETVLKLPVTVLSPEEEKSFIDFYGLPTKTLMCNKVVRLNDFEQLMPKLNEIFKDKADAYAKRVSRKRERDSIKSSSDKKSRDDGGQIAQERSAFVEKDATKSKDGGSSTARMLEKAKSVLKEFMGGKRSASEDDPSQPPSKSRKRLEAAVLKLKQQQISQDDSSGVDSPSSQNQDDSNSISDSAQVVKDTPESLQEVDTDELQVLNIVPVEETAETAEAVSDSLESTIGTVSDEQSDYVPEDATKNDSVTAYDFVVEKEPTYTSDLEAKSKDSNIQLGSTITVTCAIPVSDNLGIITSIPVTGEVPGETNTETLPDDEQKDGHTDDAMLDKSNTANSSETSKNQYEALPEPENVRDDEQSSSDVLADVGNLSVPESSLSISETKESIETGASKFQDSGSEQLSQGSDMLDNSEFESNSASRSTNKSTDVIPSDESTSVEIEADKPVTGKDEPDVQLATVANSETCNTEEEKPESLSTVIASELQSSSSLDGTSIPIAGSEPTNNVQVKDLSSHVDEELSVVPTQQSDILTGSSEVSTESSENQLSTDMSHPMDMSATTEGYLQVDQPVVEPIASQPVLPLDIISHSAEDITGPNKTTESSEPNADTDMVETPALDEVVTNKVTGESPMAGESPNFDQQLVMASDEQKQEPQSMDEDEAQEKVVSESLSSSSVLSMDTNGPSASNVEEKIAAEVGTNDERETGSESMVADEAKEMLIEESASLNDVQAMDTDETMSENHGEKNTNESVLLVVGNEKAEEFLPVCEESEARVSPTESINENEGLGELVLDESDGDQEYTDGNTKVEEPTKQNDVSKPCDEGKQDQAAGSAKLYEPTEACDEPKNLIDENKPCDEGKQDQTAGSAELYEVWDKPKNLIDENKPSNEGKQDQTAGSAEIYEPTEMCDVPSNQIDENKPCDEGKLDQVASAKLYEPTETCDVPSNQIDEKKACDEGKQDQVASAKLYEPTEMCDVPSNQIDENKPCDEGKQDQAAGSSEIYEPTETCDVPSDPIDENKPCDEGKQDQAAGSTEIYEPTETCDVPSDPIDENKPCDEPNESKEDDAVGSAVGESTEVTCESKKSGGEKDLAGGSAPVDEPTKPTDENKEALLSVPNQNIEECVSKNYVSDDKEKKYETEAISQSSSTDVVVKASQPMDTPAEIVGEVGEKKSSDQEHTPAVVDRSECATEKDPTPTEKSEIALSEISTEPEKAETAGKTSEGDDGSSTGLEKSLTPLNNSAEVEKPTEKSSDNQAKV